MFTNVFSNEIQLAAQKINNPPKLHQHPIDFISAYQQLFVTSVLKE